MGMLAFATHPRLRAKPLDAHALACARGVAANLRATGLTVDLLEYRSPAGQLDGYVLTACSPTQVLRCECRCWHLLGPFSRRAGTLLWSIDVLVDWAVEAAAATDAQEARRWTGMAMAMAHELAWDQVLEWIDGGPILATDLDAAVDQALKETAGSGSRPIVALLAGALAVGALITYGAWHAAPVTKEVISSAVIAARTHNVPDVPREPGVAITVHPLQQTRAGLEARSGVQPQAAVRQTEVPTRQVSGMSDAETTASAWRLPADRFPVERGTYRGDLDVLLKKGAVRVLTAYSKTDFFVDKGRSGGVTYEYMRALETFLQKRKGAKQPRPIVYFVPVTRDRLIPALLAGEGDLIAANLTVTPEREHQVDFSEPYLEGVKEVVVTGPTSPALTTLEDLAGKEVWTRRSSSYWGSLEALGRRFAAEKRPPLRLVEADEHLEDEDLLDMLNAGLIPLMIVDNHKARLWAKMLPNITVREDLFVRVKGRIAFALRKQSPQLKAMLNTFVGVNEKGTTFGNIVFNRYLSR